MLEIPAVINSSLRDVRSHLRDLNDRIQYTLMTDLPYDEMRGINAAVEYSRKNESRVGIKAGLQGIAEELAIGYKLEFMRGGKKLRKGKWKALGDGIMNAPIFMRLAHELNEIPPYALDREARRAALSEEFGIPVDGSKMLTNTPDFFRSMSRSVAGQIATIKTEGLTGYGIWALLTPMFVFQPQLHQMVELYGSELTTASVGISAVGLFTRLGINKGLLDRDKYNMDLLETSTSLGARLKSEEPLTKATLNKVNTFAAILGATVHTSFQLGFHTFPLATLSPESSLAAWISNVWGEALYTSMSFAQLRNKRNFEEDVEALTKTEL